MREFDPCFTPARAGLFTIAAFVFIVIFARVVTMSEQQAEVRARTAEAPAESAEPVTQGIGGIKGLRGTLP